MKVKYDKYLEEALMRANIPQESLDENLKQVYKEAAQSYALSLCREFLETMINKNIILTDITKEEIDGVFATK